MAEFGNERLQQILNVEENDFKFQVPCSISVIGPSQSGKSEWIVKLIKNRADLFTAQFQQIVYCIPENLQHSPNPIFEKIKLLFPSVQLVLGLPDTLKLNLTFDTMPKLLIIDDLMSEFLASYEMVKLLSIEVHHYNITTIVTLHNLFAPSKYGRTHARNVNYKILFNNRLDLREARNISLQICNHPNFLTESFDFLNHEFPSQPAYIVIDGHIKSPFKKLFVRSNIFPNEQNEIQPIFFSLNKSFFI